ncbi:response regulator [Desulfohalobium retbaense]|uniref:Response regulator receiver protein n=1 Tax=Desulfohalobium retbaense (strain ATCC 49708 / DSM 5692 / JCM 16813 / HR100) TaxID=485915 RepID=C8X0K8_DESRD|nr:response regulator [Desulfohalobium retbaense]ACV67955.1 response regulator receiver protein [Desulfohalobium retbaense DSM 5692]
MGYEVLVVDDSMIIRSMVAKTLRMSGLKLGTILFATNGQEGLDQLRNNQVDIVFADINMPVMDGVEMVNAMAEEGFLERVPVVIVSTERSTTRIEALKAKGVNAYLQKPFMPEQFKETVDRLLPGKEAT